MLISLFRVTSWFDTVCNTSKYCSRIILVYVHAIVLFSEVHPACHNIVNGIIPRSNSKNIDKHAAQKLYLGCKVIYVRCISCSYNNQAKGIHLLDKKVVLVYTGKFSCM